MASSLSDQDPDLHRQTVSITDPTVTRSVASRRTLSHDSVIQERLVIRKVEPTLVHNIASHAFLSIDQLVANAMPIADRRDVEEGAQAAPWLIANTQRCAGEKRSKTHCER